MKKVKKPPRLRRLIITGLFAIIALCILCLLGWCHILSRLVYVERVTLIAEDIPPSFDGKTILFVSDIDMVALNGPRSAAALFDSLERLKPDILILGGDYAGDSLIAKLNSTGDPLKLEEKRRQLFSGLADFPAPLGKYAVAGEEDASAQDLKAEMALGQITLLSDSAGTIRVGDDTISIAGLKDTAGASHSLTEAAAGFDKDDFVILVSHNPASVSSALTAEAGGGGQWCDLVLTGHTHAGQMVLGDRMLIKLTSQELRYDTGWNKESGVHILVSPGVGCDTVNLRLNTRAQVHLITLKRQEAFSFSD